MSAFILADDAINQLACTFNHYAEFGQYPYELTKRACIKLVNHLKIEKQAANSFNGVIFLNEGQSNGSASKIADALYALNTEAVNQRYQDTESTEYTGFKSKLPYTAIPAYKMLRCLLYQCSEGDVPERPLFKVLQCISDALAHDIVAGTKEFDLAAWG